MCPTILKHIILTHYTVNNLFKVLYDLYTTSQSLFGSMANDPTLDGLCVRPLFTDQRLVDMRNDATAGNGGFDEAVQLFVSSNGKL